LLEEKLKEKSKKGENMSLLADPDPSYVAKYTGEYLVYKNADGIFITEFAPSLDVCTCSSTVNAKIAFSRA